MSLRIVIIGTGFGENAMAPVYRSLGCEVEVVSPRDGAAIAAAIKAGCHLVSVHSPPFMHLEHVRLAVDNGRHVLCDKPFGRNAVEAQQMLQLASDARVLHFLNFEFRCDPLRAKMKSLLEEGAIGRPLHYASAMYMSRGGKVPHGWLFERDKGGGWIGAYASHEVDTLRWLFGEVESVDSRMRIDVKARASRTDPRASCEATAEDAVTALLGVAGGVAAVIDTAFASAVDLPGQVTVLGSDGAMRLEHNRALTLMRSGQEPELFHPPDNSNALIPALEAWLARVCAAVESGKPLAPDFSDGLACARVLDAMRDS